MQLNQTRERAATAHTHEGAPAVALGPEAELRRAVMACLLWEDSFYESGEAIAQRIARLVPLCRPAHVAACAYHARTEMKVRHAPLLLVALMTRHPAHRALIGRLLPDVIQRADEVTEFLAIYFSPAVGSTKLCAQAKKGLARALLKFDEYHLAKYDRAGKSWRLRDALFLTHANPGLGIPPEERARYTRAERRAEREATGPEVVVYDLDERERLFQRLANDELRAPDTWEVALSGGADKKATFERLMAEKKLGALAFLRNLRGMLEAGVSREAIAGYASSVPVGRVLPFRFVAAARYVPALEPALEAMMFRALAGAERLPGKTAIVVDNSGSMGSSVSARSEMSRTDAACALAVLARELCEDCVVIGFGSAAEVVPARRGFALRDAIRRGPGGGTMTGTALKLAAKEGYDRVILITDEQSHQTIGPPLAGARGYVVNVASYQHGVGYDGGWTHVDGWSEAVLSYVAAAEGLAAVIDQPEEA